MTTRSATIAAGRGGQSRAAALRRGLKLAVVACAFAAATAGCIIEAPYTSGTEQVPASVTLTADTPVAVWDVSVDRSGLPAMANVSPYQLRLRDVDPRVRVATMAPVGEEAGTGLGLIARPGPSGDVYVDVPNLGEARVVVELTEPRPGDAVTVAGTLDIPFGYPGTPAPDAHVVVTGLETPAMRAAPLTRSVRASGPTTVLDADHPVAFVPVTFALTGGRQVDPLELAGETRFELAGDIPKGAAVPTLYSVAGGGEDQRLTRHNSSAPMAACSIAPDSTCETRLMLRWQWTGTEPRVDLRYDVVTTMLGFDGVVDMDLATEFGEVIAVPPDAPAISASHEGSLEIGGSGRANAWVRIDLQGAGAAVDPQVIEVPGVLLMTYSALGRDGVARGDVLVPLRFRDTNFFRPTPAGIPEVLDLHADGTSHTIAIPIFAHCAPAEDCLLDFWLELFPPESADAVPVTVTYRFDARVTSFAGKPLARDASLEIGPKPADEP